MVGVVGWGGDAATVGVASTGPFCGLGVACWVVGSAAVAGRSVTGSVAGVPATEVPVTGALATGVPATGASVVGAAVGVVAGLSTGVEAAAVAGTAGAVAASAGVPPVDAIFLSAGSIAPVSEADGVSPRLGSGANCAPPSNGGVSSAAGVVGRGARSDEVRAVSMDASSRSNSSRCA